MALYPRRAAIAATVLTLASLARPNLSRAATRRLRIAHNNSTTSPIQAGAVGFADTVAALSEGRLAVDVFPNAQLGNETQTGQAIVEGTLDAMVTGIGPISKIIKDASLCELPYLFNNVGAARAAFDGSMGRDLAERLKAQSVLIAGWGEIGVRHITANKPVRTPGDMKGLKIRVQFSEPTIQTFLAIGAFPETMDFSQVREALRTGRFEAQENPIAVIQANNLNQVQSHISLTGHVYSPGPIIFSNDVFEELNAADRDVIMKAGVAGTKAMRDFCDNADKNGLGQLRTAGMAIVDDVDRAAFRKAGDEASEKLAKIYGTATVDRIRKLSA